MRSQHSSFLHQECYPPGGGLVSFPLSSNFISVCPITRLCGIPRNKVLPSTSAGQQRKMAVACVLEVGTSEASLLKGCIQYLPLGILFKGQLHLGAALFTNEGYLFSKLFLFLFKNFNLKN